MNVSRFICFFAIYLPTLVMIIQPAIVCGEEVMNGNVPLVFDLQRDRDASVIDKGVDQTNSTDSVTFSLSLSKLIVQDTQDRIDTIDQAGIYELLKWADHGLVFDSNVTIRPLPEKIFAKPSDYRGQLVTFHAVFNPTPLPVQLKRLSEKDQTMVAFYGHIMSENGQRAPLLALFRDASAIETVDQISITGYFYMILRTQTGQDGIVPEGTMLDYLVIAGTEIAPIETDIHDNERPGLWFRMLPVSIVLMAIIWVVLRRRVTKISK